MTPPRWTSTALLLLVTAWAAWLRWPMLEHAYAPDEFANLFHGSAWEILTDPESGVNPPLLRLLFNVPLPDAYVIGAGRWLSYLASVVTPALAYLLTKRAAADSETAGLAAAVLWAGHPEAVTMSVQFRSYSAFCAVGTWHLIALDRWRLAEGDDRDRLAWQVGISAALLPWLNYFAVPLLLVLGLSSLLDPTRQGQIRLYVPAAVLVAPMGLLVLGTDDARVPHRTPLTRVMETMIATNVKADHRFARDVVAWLPQALRPPDTARAPAALFFGSLLVAATLAWRWLGGLRRLLVLGTWGVLASVAAFSTIQLVRNPVALYVLMFLGPLAASLLAAVRPAPLRPLLAGGAVAALSTGVPERLEQIRFDPVYAEVADFADHWHAYDPERGDDPVHTWPGYTHVALYFWLTGQHVRVLPWDQGPPCDDLPGCFAVDDVIWRRMTTWDPDDPPRGLVVAFREPDEPLRAGCTLLAARRRFQAWHCPTTTSVSAGSPDTPDIDVGVRHPTGSPTPDPSQGER